LFPQNLKGQTRVWPFFFARMMVEVGSIQTADRG
jgi:hypothetical protein